MYPLKELLVPEMLLGILLFLLVFYFLFFLILKIVRATVSPEKRLTVSVRLQRKRKELPCLQDSNYARKVDVYPTQLFNHTYIINIVDC